MLKKLNILSIRLLTNNPQKINDLEKFGVRIKQRVPIETAPNSHNRFYLEAKKTKLGHLLSLSGHDPE